MKHLFFGSILVASAFAFGCSSSSTAAPETDTGTAGDTGTKTETGTDSGTVTDSAADSTPTDVGTDTGSDGGMFPTPPTLGAQIDRMGRPGVNTALNNAFVPDGATKTAAKDDYNQNSDPTTWAAKYTAQFAANLAIIDSLDAKCGNQIGAGMTAVAGRYNVLAGALADDQIYVQTSVATCTQYLGVELKALGQIMTSDCGGRVPSYDVMNITYTALATGGLTTLNVDKTSVPAKAKITAFPYLDTPS